MANIDSSFDEIVTELGDGFDLDIEDSQRKIVRSTANKIWLMLRAFSRGLYGLYQVVAALKYRFDPLYCTDEELESTLRLTGTSRRPGKVSLLTIIIWNAHDTMTKSLPADTYYYVSSNGTTFKLIVQEPIDVQPNSFMKRDFYSSLGDAPYIGQYSVSENSNITVTSATGTELDINLSFDCSDNSAQLGYPEETLFEARQRILKDNQRQEVLHILEEKLNELPNIHECTVIGNNTLGPRDSPYPTDDNAGFVKIMPQSIMVIMTGSPSADFALQFLTLCPFVTTVPEGVADHRTVSYDSSIYLDGRFPVHYVPHRIALFDVTIQYGYSSAQVAATTVEEAFTSLILDFKASTKFKQVISSEDFMKALAKYQSASVRLLAITFLYKGNTVSYMKFDRTEIARLQNINFDKVDLWL